MLRFGKTTLLAAALVTAACGSGSDTAYTAFTDVAAPSLVVRIVDGDRQLGMEGDTLRPIVVEVTNLKGELQPDVAITWRVNDDGVINAQSLVTDEHGRARAVWTLGRQDDHDGVARVTDGAAGAFSAGAPPSRVLELEEVELLRPRTYDGSRETVHPDFVRTPADWGAYTQHLAITPYPNGSSILENPSVFVSRSGYRWSPQAGVKNPLVSPTSGGYLSDPDMVYQPQARELWMYYRQVDSKNRILMVRSVNGIDWSAPIKVVEASNHSLVSPAIVRKDQNNWYMWTVNGGPLGCGNQTAVVQLRKSRDGIHWSGPATLDLTTNGLMPWHIDVQWIPSLNQFWALYPVKSSGECATRKLYLATSPDGIKWTTHATPVLEAGELPELKDIVYRSTFEYDTDKDEVRFWFSGANLVGDLAYNWRTVLQRRRRAALFQQMSTARSPLLANRPSRSLPVMMNPP